MITNAYSGSKLDRPLFQCAKTPPDLPSVQKSCYSKIGDDPGKLLAQLHIKIEKRASAHQHIPVKLTLIIKGGQCWTKLLAPPSPDRGGTTDKITKGCRKRSEERRVGKEW